MLDVCDCYWGKAKAGSPNEKPSWHSLPRHSLDVAAVGAKVLERMPFMRAWLSTKMGLPDRLLPQWISFWLALHDLGKFAEAFQRQREDLFMMLRGRTPSPTRPYTLRHDSLGMLFWTQVVEPLVIDEMWFGANSEDLADGLAYWARASTGHHGQPPQAGGSWQHHFDPANDRDAALAFVRSMRAMFIDSELSACIAGRPPSDFLASSKELSWWVAGVAVLSDWLGSNTSYFNYDDEPASLSDYWVVALRRAATAVDSSGILAPGRKIEMPFAELFPTIARPSPLQKWAASEPLHDGPQIHFLEDVTGAGKTEAALMLAHRMIAAEQADGFFIALPTMATANAMYIRIAASYQQLFEDTASLALAHGQRSLVEDFAASVVEKLAEAVLPPDADEHDPNQADNTASARCAAWLADHNKRALLAPAGVGTIDQAMLAVLHSKHQSLRLLGLMRKVLVVDEVHACDDYMEGVLSVLLEFHARAGGSAILLSATLPQRMKERLLAAFARGLQKTPPDSTATAYPLATSWPASEAPGVRQTALPARPEVSRRVLVQSCERIEDVISVISDALDLGQCVCWIRNTVDDARDAFERMRAVVPAERLMLFHARFALSDRLTLEREVLARFGPNSSGACRAGRLLIATQVIEQSLDVDFDVLITDLAPIDRVVQRAGRLRRHPRAADGSPMPMGMTDRRGEPVMWLFQPPWQEEPDASWYKAAFPKAAYVYVHHGQLWLTARALRKGHFIMPDDARELIEGVFGDGVDGPPGLVASAMAAEGRGYAALTAAQMNTLKLPTGYERSGMDWWSEAQTPSRLGEATCNVALARWEGGRLRPWVEHPRPEHAWAYSSLRVAQRLIAQEAPAQDPALQAAMNAMREELPAQGRWVVLLPLALCEDGWAGEALNAAREGQVPRRLRWSYDAQSGLRLRRDASDENRMWEES